MRRAAARIGPASFRSRSLHPPFRSPHKNGSGSSWIQSLTLVGAAALTLGAGMASIAVDGSDGSMSRCDESDAGTSFRSRTFGKYENQLRRHAPLEKVFNYFASVPAEIANANKGSGGNNSSGATENKVDRNAMYMTPEDFVRSIVPFCAGVNDGQVGSANFRFNLQLSSNPKLPEGFMERYRAACENVLKAKSQEECAAATKKVRMLRRECVVPFETHLEILKDLGTTNAQFWKEDPFVQLIDADGDGLISFREYLLFMSLLDLPRGHLHLVFRLMDESHNNALDKEEFAHALRWVCKQSADKDNFSQYQASDQYEWAGHEDFIKTKLFHDKEEITFDEFAEFIDTLHDCVAILKFEIFEKDLEGFLRPSAFVDFLAASHATVSMTPACQAYAQQLAEKESTMSSEELRACSISKDDFLHFSRFTSRLDAVSLAMHLVLDLGSGENEQGLTRKDFENCVRACADVEAAFLPPVIIDLIFTLMDFDNSGTVTKHEMIQILQPNNRRGGLDEEESSFSIFSSAFHAIVDKLGLVKGK
mmetsp:Transcript_21603/g.42437  ORF Transcript_21603/g.42437 Transcript_21603/m.42437 type:complete len:536 (-) Transcript_21603:124-1731(-)